MFKAVAVTAAFAAVGAATTTKLDELKAQTDFKDFVKKYKKQYKTEDFLQRFNAFRANMEIIAQHDAEKEGWTMALNQFADMTPEEFGAMYKGYKPRQRGYAKSQNLHVKPEGEVLADAVDWVDANAVTPVKDQAQCGSCWAFSTTGAVEGAIAISSGSDPVPLSEQQLVDCAGKYGNMGCNGGLMDDGFEYIIAKGLGSEADYKYTAKDGTCKKGVDSVASISSYTDVGATEDDLLSALQKGPVSIAIEADQSAFQLYSSGVLTKKCGKQLDHGVLLVGYGTDGGKDYWKVKNSWGSSWGEDGYIRLVRGSDECGLADEASYPVV